MTEITREEIEQLRDDLAGAFTIRAALVMPLLEHALSEQSRIDEAVAKERERCIQIVGDRIMAARFGFISAGLRSIGKSVSHAIRNPTPTTEEGR